MTDPFSWRCPYCNQIATITERNTSTDSHKFDNSNKHGPLILASHVIVCPNRACHEFVLTIEIFKAKDPTGYGNFKAIGSPILTRDILPASHAKPLPNYIPQQIVNDYEEACAIISLSPKASATLARRCLQGIIRDFWGTKKSRLIDEITAIADKVDPITWKAIDSVRCIGNIGAHMEKDIDLIIDVDPDEAALLIHLIETLLEEWYVHRFEREQQMQKVIDAAASKKAAKTENSADGK